jgi:hypothetical protein
MNGSFSTWLSAHVPTSFQRRRRPQGYSVIIWRERTTGRRAMTYGADASDGLTGHKEILTLSPPPSGVSGFDTWEPIQHWDQHNCSFMDITSQGPQ